MRLRSGGLLACWVAHVLADSVIFVFHAKGRQLGGRPLSVNEVLWAIVGSSSTYELAPRERHAPVLRSAGPQPSRR